MTKTCQHCQTELTNPRAKNCQTCTTILNEANKYGVYAVVMSAIFTAKEDGFTGAEMHAVMQSAKKFGQEKRSEWKSEYRKMQAAKVAKGDADARFYQINGYFPWQTERTDEDARLDIIEAEQFVPAKRMELDDTCDN